MKLAALLSSISLLAAGTFASPVTHSLETQRSDGEENLVVSRDDGLKCASHQYSDGDMSDALGAGATMLWKAARSEAEKAKDRDGNDEVSLPSDSLCAQSGATKYEWPFFEVATSLVPKETKGLVMIGSFLQLTILLVIHPRSGLSALLSHTRVLVAQGASLSAPDRRSYPSSIN
ncbi:hypothetical protein N7505_007581 [Penicillium chrysogenum]|uniref:Uncharacterized protein n=1 Tax=Penicillium chrysogenum TaxID=5076 RepID=A0ABQ8WEH9_PENCH|nr:hypothetical protein N7505_007581 [Penicillium chrysogenum]